VRHSYALLLLLLTVACRDPYKHPSAKIGTADVNSGGTTHSVSAKFSAADLKVFYNRLMSPDFQLRLASYTCGDPPPKYAFTVSIFERAEYQERHVLVQNSPEIHTTGRDRCLMFGLDYEVERELYAIDRGDPINYHYRDPHTGKELPADVYTRRPSQKPACDCANRDAAGEWVTFGEPQTK